MTNRKNKHEKHHGRFLAADPDGHGQTLAGAGRGGVRLAFSRFVREANLQKDTVQVKLGIENPAPEPNPEMLAMAQFFAGGGAANPQGAPMPA